MGRADCQPPGSTLIYDSLYSPPTPIRASGALLFSCFNATRNPPLSSDPTLDPANGRRATHYSSESTIVRCYLLPSCCHKFTSPTDFRDKLSLVRLSLNDIIYVSTLKKLQIRWMSVQLLGSEKKENILLE